MSSKRKPDKNSFVKSKVKYSRVHGLPYINSKGDLVPGKSVGENCGCQMGCYNRVSQEQRTAALTALLNLENKDTQDIFLQALIVEKQVQCRRRRDKDGNKRTDDDNRRQHTYEYSVMVGSEQILVCKKAFLNIYAVSQKRVFRLAKLLSKGEVPKDLRGTNPKPNKISESITNLIDEHIQSFPLLVTEYEGQEYKYLSAKLDIKRMHGLFAKKYPVLNVKYDFYRSYFKDNFNYAFGCPEMTENNGHAERTVKNNKRKRKKSSSSCDGNGEVENNYSEFDFHHFMHDPKITEET